MLQRCEPDPRPLIAHIVFRFDYGGLENGVVNLINRMPDNSFRHCVIALTKATAFRDRITKADVVVYSIGKRAGKDPKAYLRLYRLLCELKPAIVHTRNLGTLECLLVAWLAGAPVRIHGEHGWDIYDPHGTSRKYRLLRRFADRFVHRWVTVSQELADWLAEVGISREKITRICNGVDTARFHPRGAAAPTRLPAGIFAPGSTVIGSVTRFSTIKDPLNLVRAFVKLHHGGAEGAGAPRLVMIGDGELREQAEQLVREGGVQEKAWLAGSRDDVPEMLRSMDVFVLGSRREGISNTILEAMATGLPVIATATGGNGELVEDGVTGKLVPQGDSAALEDAIAGYIADAVRRERHGLNARARVESNFSLSVMVESYQRLYGDLLQRVGA